MGILTDHRPKGLTKLGGISLLERQISVLRHSDIEQIGIVRGYMAERIQLPNITYFHNAIWNETNMLYSLLCAEDWLSADECIVAYSDIVYQREAIRMMCDCPADLAVPFNLHWLKLWIDRFEDPLTDAETFRINENKMLIEIGERTRSLDRIEGQFMGLMKTTPKGWSRLKGLLEPLSDAEVWSMDITAMLSLAIRKGIEIQGLPYDGFWLEVDSESDLRRYERDYVHQLN